MFHEERFELKALQSLNMYSIYMQFDVFHKERSELKAEQPSNMQYIFVQFETSHRLRSFFVEHIELQEYVCHV